MNSLTGAVVFVYFSLASVMLNAQIISERTTYIQAGALLDNPAGEPRGASTIVVRGTRIESILDGFVAPEAGADLVDLRDQFVLPGLIDMHVHMFNDDDKMQARLESTNRDLEDSLLIGVANSRKTIEAGFTTVRDLSSDVRAITALRDSINAGNISGPTIVPAGRMISATAGHGDPTNNINRELTSVRRDAEHLCDGADDCRRAVRSQLSQGAELIKFAATGGVNSNIAGGLEQQLFPDEMQAIVDTAHLLGLRVTAHAHGKNGIKAALEAGVDSIEHGTYTDAETNRLFKEKGAWLVPTLLAGNAALQQARAGARSQATLEKAELAVASHHASVSAAIRDGVRVAFGTDTGVSDHGRNAEEFALLVEAGLSNQEALKAATVYAAELLGRSETLGTLQPGYSADIIAVEGNPLENISELERIRFVMKRGVVYKLGGQRQAFPPVGGTGTVE